MNKIAEGKKSKIYPADISSILEGYNSSGEEISKLVRYIGFGLIGLYLAVLNSRADSIKSLETQSSNLFLIAAAFGVVTIILEYTNFVLRRWAYARMVKVIEAGEADLLKSSDGKHTLFNDETWLYWWAKKVFLAKQVAAVLGCLIVLIIFFRRLFLQ